MNAHDRVDLGDVSAAEKGVERVSVTQLKEALAATSGAVFSEQWVDIGGQMMPSGRLDELTEAAFSAIDSLAAHGASEENLAKVKETQRRQRETDLKENSFWLSVLNVYDRNEEDLRLILDYDRLVEGLTAEAIGEVADHRREEELHGGVGEHEQAAIAGRCGYALAGDFHQELRQHRHDDAEADGVQQHRDKDKSKCQLGPHDFLPGLVLGQR